MLFFYFFQIDRLSNGKFGLPNFPLDNLFNPIDFLFKPFQFLFKAF